MITTTLNRIVRAGCLIDESWARLLKGLGKTKPDDAPLPFSRIVKINGLEDAVFCLEAEPQYAREWRLFSVWCARRVQHLVTNPDCIAAMDVAHRYANGAATDDELARAADAVEISVRLEPWPGNTFRAAWAASLTTTRADAAWAARSAAISARAALGFNSALSGRGSARMAARAAADARAAELAAQTAEFLRIVTETEART